MERQEFKFKTVKELAVKLLECDLYCEMGTVLHFDFKSSSFLWSYTNKKTWEPLKLKTWLNCTLYSVPQIKDKTPVSAWNDDMKTARVNCFYDAKYDGTFMNGGSRHGFGYGNYKILDPIPEWMIEAAKHLED